MVFPDLSFLPYLVATLRSTIAAAFRPANIPAVLALGVIVVFGVFVDQQNRVLSEQRRRTDVLSEVNLIRARLEGHINGNIQLVRGLVATLATEPAITQARFAQLAASLFREKSQLRNIAGAPDLVVSLMYPVAGNERAIGLDYRANLKQRDLALRARDSGELVFAGPVDLVQGGRGLIGRFPVFTPKPNGGKSFWGIVSAVVDIDKLYRESGLLDADLPIDVALVGLDARGRNGVHFYGDAKILERRPVTVDVHLPSGLWQVAAIPKTGWDATPDGAWRLRFMILFASALVVVPTFLAGRFLDGPPASCPRSEGPRVRARATVPPAGTGARHLEGWRLGDRHRDVDPVSGTSA